MYKYLFLQLSWICLQLQNNITVLIVVSGCISAASQPRFKHTAGLVHTFVHHNTNKHTNNKQQTYTHTCTNMCSGRPRTHMSPWQPQYWRTSDHGDPGGLAWAYFTEFLLGGNCLVSVWREACAMHESGLLFACV